MTDSGDACLTEEDVLQMLEEGVSPEERERLDAHIDGCPKCLDFLVQAARGLSMRRVVVPEDETSSHGGAEAAGESLMLSIGSLVQERYEIQERVGVGAMGVVYAAFDRVLDRRVALKVLRSDRFVGADERAQAQVLREARVLARLSHPNVIVIYDVFPISGRVVVSMELVAGRTLRAWLDAPRRPSFDEILAAFLSAGRGLAAAHAVGVVHRDFKPDNVLIGGDGRVRVTDFGLADAPLETLLSDSTSSAEVDPSETRRYAVGTPRYMPPEQFVGSEVSARSDQFAFAVALYEALYREHPFPLLSLSSRLAVIRKGKWRPPARRGVPRWVRGALQRALHGDPDRRFPSMEAMGDALNPMRRRKMWVFVGTAALTVAAATLGATVFAPAAWSSGQSCEAASARLAGIWDEDLRQEQRAVIAASGDPTAVDAWAALEREFDTSAALWAERYDATCRDVRSASGAEGQESRTILACLDRSVEWIRVAVQMARRADGETLSFLLRRQLPTFVERACANAEIARDYQPLPEPGPDRSKVVELRMRLEEEWDLEAAGRLQDARALISRLTEEARAIGFRPLIAEVLRRRGVFEHRMGALEEAFQSLESALATAETGRDEALIPQIWLELALLEISRGRLSEAGRALDRATAFNARYPPSQGTAAQMNSVRASILRALGRHHEAIEVERQLREYHETVTREEALVASSLVFQAHSHAAIGELEEALDLNHRALVIRERLLGPMSSRVAGVLNNVGGLLVELGEYHEAAGYLQRALVIRESLGVGSEIEVANVLLNLAQLAREEGRMTDAREYLERAVEIRVRHLGGRHLAVGEALEHLGVLLLDEGKIDSGWQSVEQAWKIRERALGTSHPLTALALVWLARAEYVRGELASARMHAEQANAILSTANVKPVERAAGDFVLAQVLDAASEPLRVRRLAEEALATFRSSGPAYERQADEVETFMEALRRAPE